MSDEFRGTTQGMTAQGPTTWRYQPVWIRGVGGRRRFSMAHIEVDKYGALVNWVVDEAPPVYANNLEDLREESIALANGAHQFEPVAYETLRAGRLFKAAVIATLKAEPRRVSTPAGLPNSGEMNEAV